MVFVVAGIRSHHEVGALDLFLRNAVPLEVAWFAVSAVAATYRRPGLRTLLWTWIVAVPTGLVVRSIWVGSPSGTRLLVFVGIGLAVHVAVPARRSWGRGADRPATAAGGCAPNGARNVIR